MPFEIRNEHELRGQLRLGAGVLGFVGVATIVAAVAERDLDMLTTAVPFTIMTLGSALLGRSVFHHVLRPVGRPRRPDVDPALLDRASDEVRARVREGRHDEALRVYRRQTGEGGYVGKAVVAGLAWREMETRVRPLLADVSPEVRDLALRDRTIAAVRLYRRQTGASLAAAYDLVHVIQTDADEQGTGLARIDP